MGLKILVITAAYLQKICPVVIYTEASDLKLSCGHMPIIFDKVTYVISFASKYWLTICAVNIQSDYG